jgi:hypothetical protein
MSNGLKTHKIWQQILQIRVPKGKLLFPDNCVNNVCRNSLSAPLAIAQEVLILQTYWLLGSGNWRHTHFLKHYFRK